MALYIVIMAGGKGERLWPLSRKGMPKQLLCFDGENSLLSSTVSRSLGLVDPEHVMFVTNAEIESKVIDALPDLPGENILAEPVGRNTAPCIAYAAMYIRSKDPDAVMCVLPSDHVIGDVDSFLVSLRFAAACADANPDRLITLGIVPDHPESGYGYIAPGNLISKEGGLSLLEVSSFKEKPDVDVARQYMEDGYLWNAGMFIWRVGAILDAFSRYLPGMYDELVKVTDTGGSISEFYERTESISIDYGVLEKADNVAVIPSEFGWSDIGSWDALGKILDADEAGNVVKGNAECFDSSNNVVWSNSKRVVLVGMEDVVVVEAGDSVLVCRRDRSQDVSMVSKALEGK